MVEKKVIPKQEDLAFPDKGIPVNDPEKVDHSAEFGLEPKDFGCFHCEAKGRDNCPIHKGQK